ncbi:MAG: ADP-ribosylglycohydrolase family protein [Pseudomonadota bacterium]
MTLTDRAEGALLGLAAGDATGTTVEFKPRGSFTPLTDMIGGGPFGLEPGQWTDDTSMALCLATSLVDHQGFDADDQMRRYCRWATEGYMSSNGRCFDIGNTVSSALRAYQQSGDPYSGSTDPHSAGNGSIMRLAPIALFYFPDEQTAMHYAAESSRVTHGADECLDACRLLASLLHRALDGQSRNDVLFGTGPVMKFDSPAINAIAAGSYVDKDIDNIRGTGYVVNSLEAALWCFYQTDSFSEAILLAANLGDDADTTAAVCGQVAGAYYGINGIPEHWIERVSWSREIQELARRLLR